MPELDDPIHLNMYRSYRRGNPLLRRRPRREHCSSVFGQNQEEDTTTMWHSSIIRFTPQ
jgi:hypothetical protein